MSRELPLIEAIREAFVEEMRLDESVFLIGQDLRGGIYPHTMGLVDEFGADRVVDRSAELVSEVDADSIDVVVDLVAGDGWPPLLDVLRRGGRYVTAGAIAGPLVEFDVRTLYLKDLTLFGCTFQDDAVFDNLVGYIERNEIRPLVSATFPLEQIVEAQQQFLQKKFIGKLVLIPPA